MGKKLISIASIVGFTLALGYGSAFGALTGDEIACINAINKDFAKVAATQGKENGACVANASKGKEANPQACLTADAKGKVLKTKNKTLADETKNCGGGAPIGYTSAANANAAAMDKEIDLIGDIFGSNLTGTIQGGANGACQAAVIKAVQKIQDTKLKEFNACKKTALKNGAMAAVDLENCLGPDPKGKIGKTIIKLGDTIPKKCPGGIATTLFPGECTGLDGNALRDCLDRLVECRACLAINDADGLNKDCDLFDDGLANNSCPPIPAIGDHKCTLAPGSALNLWSALPLPPLPATGAVDFSCGPINPGTGKADCDCSVQAPGFGALNIAGLFWACVKPAISGTCPTGEIDCDGGNVLGLDMTGARNIGPCASNAACAATCAATCAPDAVFAAQCEGFCTLGAQMACLTDAACGVAGQGACNGPDGVGFGNICDCTCLDDATGGASSAGDLKCQLAFNLTVEPNPGNGMACDGADVSINVGDTCAPLSTQSAMGILTNGNNVGAVFPPGGFADTGLPFDCVNLATSDTSGAKLTGAAQFYASTIGDIDTQLTILCQ